MFGPGANRLCKFLEISAMSVSLAPGGGEQGKQGYLVRSLPCSSFAFENTSLTSFSTSESCPAVHPDGRNRASTPSPGRTATSQSGSSFATATSSPSTTPLPSVPLPLPPPFASLTDP